MGISTDIQYVDLEQLLLDPKNPRLGRRNIEAGLTQEQILDRIAGWSLEELAESFLQNSFWPQEALIVVMDPEVSADHLIVAEGNRRVAALKLLKQAFEGSPRSAGGLTSPQRCPLTAYLSKSLPFVLTAAPISRHTWATGTSPE